MLYFGGVSKANERLYAGSVSNVNAHFDEHIDTELFPQLFDPTVDTRYPITPRRRFPYSSIAYALSSNAAQKLLSMIEEEGFHAPVATTLVRLMDLHAGCYFSVYPKLVSASVAAMAAEHDGVWPKAGHAIQGAPALSQPAHWHPSL